MEPVSCADEPEGARPEKNLEPEMEKVHYTDLIITCEACGSVKKYIVQSHTDAEKLFAEFQCENGCGRNLYSFITLGTLEQKSPELGEAID